jgi:hypothetical protein
MADRAAELVAKWKQRPPPTAPRGEVERVVEAHFSGEHHAAPTGSHGLIIESPHLELAQELGYTQDFQGGTLSISFSGGREVKRVYIKLLLEAISIKAACR